MWRKQAQGFGVLHPWACGDSARPFFTAPASPCRTDLIPAHGSFLSDASRWPRLRMVKWSDVMSGVSSSQVSGVDTGAPGRARVEYGTTAVAPRVLRR